MVVSADYAPVLAAIREVAQGAGSVRTVDTQVHLRAYAAEGPQEAARAIVKPGISVSLDERVHPQKSWSEIASIKSVDIGIAVRIEWPVPFELNDQGREDMRAAAWGFEDELRSALQRPGNLRATSAGTATRIRGACLDRYAGAKVEREDFPKRRFSILSRYRCFIDAPQETA